MTMLESWYSGRRTLAILAASLVIRREDLSCREFGDISSLSLSRGSWTRGLVGGRGGRVASYRFSCFVVVLHSLVNRGGLIRFKSYDS